MLTGKIDVKKITKAKLYVGKSGTYLDIILIPTPDNKFGDDYMIVESTTKDERANGVKGVILGNAKLIKKQEPAPQTFEQMPTYAERANGGGDDLPF